MPIHFFARFDPPPDVASHFRSELLNVVGPTRAEPGCRSIHVFESIREPAAFAIHSEWEDEAAFELHSELPHTVRFVAAAERLLGYPIRGLRAKERMVETNDGMDW
jgi:quinol monooxygenase YgiN